MGDQEWQARPHAEEPELQRDKHRVLELVRGGEVIMARCCPKTSRPTTNATLIGGLSCRARYIGKIAPCALCTDNGRFLDGRFLSQKLTSFAKLRL